MKNFLPLLLLLSGAAQAQLLTFDGDGFEACPRGAMTFVTLASWNSVFAPFPSQVPFGAIRVQKGLSVGLLLTAPTAPTSGQIQVQVREGDVGEALLSLSRCDSVYPPNPASCVSAVSTTPKLQWTTDPAGDGCRLEPGVSYFFNTTMGTQTEPGGGQPWCSNWLIDLYCDVKLTATVQ